MSNRQNLHHTPTPGALHPVIATCAALGVAAFAGAVLWDARFRHGVIAISCLVSILFALPCAVRQTWLKYVSLAGALLVATLLLIPLRQRCFFLGYDVWTHLALSWQVMTNGLFPGDPHLAGSPTPPFLSLVHWLNAAIGAATGIPIYRFWDWTVFAGLAASLLAHWAVARAWLRSPSLALGAILIAGAASCGWWFIMNYPSTLSLTTCWLAVAARLSLERRLSAGEDLPLPWGWSALTGLLVGITIGFHLFGGFAACVAFLVWELVVLGTMPEVRAWSRRRLACRLAWLPVGLAIGAPFIANTLIQLISSPERNPFQYGTHPQLIVLGHLGKLAVVMLSPAAAIKPYPMLVVLLAAAGLAALIVRLRHLRGSERAIGLFVLVISLLPVLLVCTPLLSLLVPLTGAHHSIRFLNLIPFPMLAMLALAPWIDLPAPGADTPPLHPRLARFLPLAAPLVIMLLGLALTIPAGRWIHQQIRILPLGPSIEPRFATELIRLAPMLDGRIVFTDPETAYFVPAYTHAKVVAIDASHVSPYVDPGERLRDVELVLRGNAGSADVSRVLDRWQVAYVLLNDQPFTVSANDEFRLVRDAYAAPSVHRLKQHPRLEPVETPGPFTLLRVLPPGQARAGGG